MERLWQNPDDDFETFRPWPSTHCSSKCKNIVVKGISLLGYLSHLANMVVQISSEAIYQTSSY